MKSYIKSYKIWFTYPASLEELGHLLLKKKILQYMEFDYENVYEWLDTSSTNSNVALNFSRKHGFHEGTEELTAAANPITLLLSYEGEEPDDTVVEEIAQTIHSALDCTVF